MQVNILDAKNQLSRLLQAAQSGEDVVIANRGRPVARLIPIRAGTVDGSSGQEGLVPWLERHPLAAHARRTTEEIDTTIATERETWDGSAMLHPAVG